mmetsp:Transcript_7187/g.16406  ORF Transcript_7187/g.16406 Transcript_7187/m.16406 type:complete len:556 (+) Transcript_7187:3-1670(+)
MAGQKIAEKYEEMLRDCLALAPGERGSASYTIRGQVWRRHKKFADTFFLEHIALFDATIPDDSTLISYGTKSLDHAALPEQFAFVTLRPETLEGGRSVFDTLRGQIRCGDVVEIQGVLERPRQRLGALGLLGVRVATLWHWKENAPATLRFASPKEFLPRVGTESSPRTPVTPRGNTDGEPPYCKMWLNQGKCNKPGCSYLHALVPEETGTLGQVRQRIVAARRARRQLISNQDAASHQKRKFDGEEEDKDTADGHEHEDGSGGGGEGAASRCEGAASRCQRASVFASWLLATFPRLQQSGVLDIAGGRGDLTFELAVVRQVPSTVVDPRPVRFGKRQHRFFRQQRKRANKAARTRVQGQGCDVAPEGAVEGSTEPAAGQGSENQEEMPTALLQETKGPRSEHSPVWAAAAEGVAASSMSLAAAAECVGAEAWQVIDQRLTHFDDAFIAEHRALVEERGVVVGLHPDEATEPLVDLALKTGKAFAVVPCCVFAADNPHRALPDGRKPSSYSLFLDYLQGKAPPGVIQRDRLGFHGKNVVLWSAGNEHGLQAIGRP